MKLTKQQLKRIIKEEYRKLLNETEELGMDKLKEMWDQGYAPLEKIKMLFELIPAWAGEFQGFDLSSAWPEDARIKFNYDLRNPWLIIDYETKELTQQMLKFANQYLQGNKIRWQVNNLMGNWSLVTQLPDSDFALEDIPTLTTIEILSYMTNPKLHPLEEEIAVATEELKRRRYVGPYPAGPDAYHEMQKTGKRHHLGMMPGGGWQLRWGKFKLDQEDLDKLQQEL